MNAELVVDLDRFRANLEALRTYAPDALQMMVVKANAYGHGMVPMARAARDVSDWLGVATADEALQLRAAGDRGPLLCWLATPGAPFAELVDRGVDLTASGVDQLDEAVVDLLQPLRQVAGAGADHAARDVAEP